MVWALQRDSGWALQGQPLQGDSGVGHFMETLGLGNLGRLWWALGTPQFSRVGHSRETLSWGTSGRLQADCGSGNCRSFWNWALQVQGTSGWALQGDFGVGHGVSGLGTPGHWGWARQGNSEVGHLRSLWVGHSRKTPGHSGGSHSGFGHSRESLGVDRARRRVPCEEKS